MKLIICCINLTVYMIDDIVFVDNIMLYIYVCMIVFIVGGYNLIKQFLERGVVL